MNTKTELSRFLSALAESVHGEVVSGSCFLPSATRAQDAARRKAKKDGLAYFAKKPNRWIITAAGRAFVANTGNK